MTSRLPAFALMVATVAIWPMISAAQETKVEELQKKLEQRDKVILELLERVEALERRMGVNRDRSEDAVQEQKRVEGQASSSTRSDDEPQTFPASDAKATEQRAPGEVVVDEDAAERALERSLTEAGALLLRPGRVEIEPSFSYARNEDATPIFVSSGGSTFSGEQERNVDSLTGDLSVRLGLPWKSQLEVGIPYRWRNVENVTNVGFSPVGTSSQTGAGLGDFRVGVAKTLLREGIWRPDLIGRVTWDTDTGQDSDDGVSLGGGFNEIRGSLTAVKRQDPMAFVAGLSYEHTFENDNIEPGDTVSFNFGGFIALSPETSLRLLVIADFQQETEVSGSAIDGSDQTIGTFVVGGSTLLSPGVLLDLSAGIGLTDDADDFSVTLSMPIRFNSPIF